MSAPLELAFDEYGDGGHADGILILHGLFGSKSNWRSIARRLAAQHRVFCLDLRNHGASPWHEQMDYPALAADVAAFIQRHGLRRPTLIGHSMGGKTAMHLAQAADVDIRRLLIVDIAPVPYTHDHHALIQAMQSVDFSAAPGRDDVERQLAPAITEPTLRGFLLQNLERRDGGLCWRINLAAIAANMHHLVGYPEAPPTDTPAVIIAGDDSDYVAAHHAAIHTLLPKARIEVIEGAGHWLHAQKPGELFDLITRHLAADTP